MKYILHIIDLRSENPWDNKAVYLLYTELITGKRVKKNKKSDSHVEQNQSHLWHCGHHKTSQACDNTRNLESMSYKQVFSTFLKWWMISQECFMTHQYLALAFVYVLWCIHVFTGVHNNKRWFSVFYALTDKTKCVFQLKVQFECAVSGNHVSTCITLASKERPLKIC